MVGLKERLSNYKKQFDNYTIKKKILKFNNYCTKHNPFEDFSKHIIICGEPRGGTTWLMELLMNKSDCLIWEPLHFVHLNNYKKDFI